MSTESTILGVSVRALLAIIAVSASIAYIFAVTFFKDDPELTDVALAAMVGFGNLALGFYLGQKTVTANGG